MSEKPRYFVTSWGGQQRFRCYSRLKYFDPDPGIIWRGDDYHEGLRVAKEANARGKEANVAREMQSQLPLDAML